MLFLIRGVEGILCEDKKHNMRLELLKVGIDMNIGLKYCGDIESYKQILCVAVKNYPDKCYEIKRFCDEEDYRNYTVAVHALKSSAANIGAKQLCDLASVLEKAGNENNVELIKDKTEKLLDMYADIIDVVSSLMNCSPETVENKKEQEYHIHEEIWKDNMVRLKELLDELEAELALNLIDELNKTDVSDSAKDLLDKIKYCLDKFDIEGAKMYFDSLVRTQI